MKMTCLQIQSKLIAVIEIVISSLALIFLGFSAVIVTTKRDALLEAINKYPEEYPHMRQLLEATTLEQLSLFLIPTFYFISELGLGVLLYQSAHKLNHKRLRLWFISTVTLLLVGIVFFLAEVLRTEEFMDIILMFIINLAFTIYSLWVVHCLINKIKSGGIHHPVPFNNGFFKL